MKNTVMFAAAALMALSAGTAFAEGGGGNGGSNLYTNAAGAPPGFFSGVPGYDARQSMQAYVIRQQNAALAARDGHQVPVAQSQTPSNG
jgi:hypothetical protein